MLINVLSFFLKILAVVFFATSAFASDILKPGAPGSAEKPLRVMLVPTDGGTEDGTKADFTPIFNAVSRTSGLKFEIRVGQSYASVVEALVNNLVDIAFVGPTLYLKAAEKGAAEPLAVAVLSGESVYYAGFFAKPGFDLSELKSLEGKSMAFGDVNSSSSFTIQVGMMIKDGIDPARDLSRVYLTGGHANSLNALSQGLVDVAAASFNSYQKAVNKGVVNSNDVVPVARSVPIPYPPFIMLPSLPEDIKTRLRNGFDTVHEDPNITPEMIRGFGGIVVDRYTSDITHQTFQAVQEMLDLVTSDVKGAMLKKAASNR
jgi:phosphonate transport system substrate-binding protein